LGIEKYYTKLLQDGKKNPALSRRPQIKKDIQLQNSLIPPR
jgi:hypothetical protein